MFPLVAKLNEALEYQTETVAASATTALMVFVYSRAFVQVLPAVSVMEKWSFVYPSVIARWSVARTMTPTLPAVSWAEGANVHVVDIRALGPAHRRQCRGHRPRDGPPRDNRRV